MIWTKQPIKKEIRALNDAVTTLNSNLGQFTRFNASSISEMQTNLLSSANALENKQTIVVGFYSSISGDALFRSGYVYAGNLYVNYKVGSELVFSVSLYGPFGENIDISYQNGTWYYGGTKKLKSTVSNRAFTSLSDSIENGADLNTILASGIYYGNNVTVTNAPTSAIKYFHLLVFGLNNSTIIQMYFYLGGTVFIRGIYSGTVSQWEQLAPKSSVDSLDSKIAKYHLVRCHYIEPTFQNGYAEYDLTSQLSEIGMSKAVYPIVIISGSMVQATPCVRACDMASDKHTLKIALTTTYSGTVGCVVHFMAFN